MSMRTITITLTEDEFEAVQAYRAALVKATPVAESLTITGVSHGLLFLSLTKECKRMGLEVPTGRASKGVRLAGV
jgi:hypothetical protein